MVPKKHSKSTLFELVKRLTVQEKRALFRGYHSLHQSEVPAYLQLLSLVDQSAEADDEQWFNSLKPSLKLTKDEYRQLKKYLTDKLVNHLVSQQEISPRVEISRLIAQAEVFYLRGLLTQALVVLYQALEIADEFEFVEEKVAIYEWIYKVYLHQGNLDEASSTLSLASQNNEALDNLKQHQLLHAQLLLSEKKMADNVAYSQLDMASFSNHPLIAGSGNTQTVRAKLFLAASSSIYWRLNLKFDASLVALQQLMHLLQQHPKVRLSNPNLVIDSYRNLGLTYLALRQYQQLDTLLEQLKEQQFLSQGQTLKLRLLISRLKISSAINQGDLKLAEQTAIALEADLEAYKHDTAFRTDVAFALTQAWVMTGNHKQAIQALGQLINSEYVYGKQLQYEASIRMMEIAVHAEMGNIDFIKNRLRSLQHFYKAHDLPEPVLSTNAIVLLSKAQNNYNRIAAFEQLITHHIAEDQHESNLAAFSYLFDWDRWAKLRLSATSKALTAI